MFHQRGRVDKDTDSICEPWELAYTSLIPESAPGSNLYKVWIKSVLTPQLVVIGAAAGLPAAVACLAEVAAGTVGTGTVTWAAQERQGSRAVVLHSLQQSVAPPQQPLLLFLHDRCRGNSGPRASLQSGRLRDKDEMKRRKKKSRGLFNHTGIFWTVNLDMLLCKFWTFCVWKPSRISQRAGD